MAKVADVFHLHLEEEEEEEFEEEPSQLDIDFDAETLDPSPFFASFVFEEEEETLTLAPPIFSPESNLQRSDFDDQITLTLDLFDRCPHPEALDTSDFGAFDAMTSDYLGLGLGLGFEVEEQDQEEEEEGQCMDQRDGLRAVGFFSDSETEEDPNPHHHDLCWDSLRLEEDQRDFGEDFEWEEIDGRLDQRDLLSMMVGERSRSSETDEEDELEEELVENVDWEVLLHVSNVVVEDEDYINPSEYEILFADHDSAIRGSPPAAKLVVENLPYKVLTQEDLAKNNATCAVCKDEILLEEKVRQLPCMHHYHGDCILPWLGMRNTCPVCRYELPTDDPEYERWKARRRTSHDGMASNDGSFMLMD
ncbi:E3 ubiquitin-protein ligase CIP8-like isoform X2 [Asparagus officinalis]|uniref:E3 ubiquitin-protein ligase CIP8-like isoform X2 n=1 Tax=Asparagus officinalis TaxID=4686 RepID=UPI00098DE9FC|nr:E3 ubiquitin-protein ligase CIP8-like isoform X2 [Asparagus officinalis]